jgi:hypothetical protein
LLSVVAGVEGGLLVVITGADLGHDGMGGERASQSEQQNKNGK